MYVFASRIKRRSGIQAMAIRGIALMMRMHKAEGLHGIQLIRKDGCIWVREVWRDKAAMVRYRTSPGHQRMFGRMKKLFGQRSHVQFESEQVPDWEDIRSRMPQLPPAAAHARRPLRKRALRMLPAMMAVMIAVMLFVVPSPVDPVSWRPPLAPAEEGAYAPNGLLGQASLLADGKLAQPEDIAFDHEGMLYAGTKDGFIHRLRLSGDGAVADIERFAETGGYPLGLAFREDGSLVAAVKGKGLAAVQPDGTVEMLAEVADGMRIAYANEVAIARNGLIYFTDSSSAFDMGWPYDILEARPHGRLLAYDPANGQTRVLLDDLYFANGLALSREEDYLLIAETPRYRIQRYWLTGPRAHTMEPFADNLPLLPDNLFIDQAGDVWVGGSRRMAVIDMLQPRAFVKRQIAKLPYGLLKRVPGMNRYGLALRLNAEGQVMETLHDPSGKVYGVSSVVRLEDTLYVGTLFGDSVARLELR